MMASSDFVAIGWAIPCQGLMRDNMMAIYGVLVVSVKSRSLKTASRFWMSTHSLVTTWLGLNGLTMRL